MLAMIEISYAAKALIEKYDRDNWNRLASHVPQLNMDEWKEDAEKHPHWWNHGKIMIDLITHGALLMEMGVEFDVKNFKNCYRVKSNEPAVAGTVNHLTLAIPNVALLAIDEVQVLEDSCTDQLQNHLDDGWRIVAICPPNAARRPDYVLGRTKK
jgi:hypothetical protein